MSGNSRPDVKLPATSDTKDKMYEPKHKKKLVRVLTVVAYVFSVSLAAITLSLFYIFIYNPDRPNQRTNIRHHRHEFNISVRMDDWADHKGNQSWAAPEEPRALPIQLAQPQHLPEEMSQLHSDESAAENYNSQETYKQHRGKRAIKTIRKVLKISNGT